MSPQARRANIVKVSLSDEEFALLEQARKHGGFESPLAAWVRTAAKRWARGILGGTSSRPTPKKRGGK